MSSYMPLPEHVSLIEVGLEHLLPRLTLKLELKVL